MKALPLVWKDPQKYKSHVIFPGAFHTKMNYIKMLTGKKARGSGYAEILLESRLVESSGCLKSVLSGKAFSKALFNLKATVEALHRLLFEVFVEEHQDLEIRPQALLDLIKKCSRTQLDATLEDVSTMQLLNLYKTFKEKVRKGHLGKTGRFWISFMDDANLVFLLIHAAKTNNRMLFHKCNGEMANLFFAFDGQNYSRYLAWFETFLTNLELTHPGATDFINKGVLGAARSLIPGSLSDIDRTMEETLIQYKEQNDLAFKLLVKSQMLSIPLNLQVLMRYCLLPVDPCLGTVDGYFFKTNKAAPMHYLVADYIKDVVYPDGNALFYTLTNLAQTFRGISLNILDLMLVKRNFIFSTDCYDTDSIKSQERKRRGCGEKLLLDGPATHKPKDFKQFLSNEENKQQLCRLLLNVWTSSPALTRIQKCENAYLVVDGSVHHLKAVGDEVEKTEIHELHSNQEETDTRIILYIHYAANQGYKSVVVRTPDTDIFFILLHHAHDAPITIYVDIGTGKKRRLINVSEISKSLGSDWCTALLGYYVFTGEDCTSAFKGKGKVQPMKKLMKMPKFHPTFRRLGDAWTVPPEVYNELEEFTCAMYGYTRDSSINNVRTKMLKKMVGEDQKLDKASKVDLSRLPPCQDALIPHIDRVNHRTACFKKANIPIYEKPKPHDGNQGWLLNDKGELEPRWTRGPVLPQSLIDLIDDAENEEDDEDEEVEIELGEEEEEEEDDD